MKPITVKTAIAAAAAAFALCAAANDRAAAARNAYKLEAALQETRQLAEQFDVLSRNQEILDTRLANLEKASGAGASLQVQIDELRSAQESLREAISAQDRPSRLCINNIRRRPSGSSSIAVQSHASAKERSRASSSETGASISDGNPETGCDASRLRRSTQALCTIEER